jgi:hypothetical protein
VTGNTYARLLGIWPLCSNFDFAKSVVTHHDFKKKKILGGGCVVCSKFSAEVHLATAVSQIERL